MSETFLNRWARRKAEARQHDDDHPEPESESQATAEDQQPDRAEDDAPPDEETKQRWIAELEKVDVDSLKYDDDFAVYMKDWVPGALRQRALRKLWTSNPTLACLDGLNDYEEDFTDAGTVVANMKSDWLPGRGYKFLDSLTEDEVASDTPAPEAPDGGEQVQEPGEVGDEPVAEAADDVAPEDAGPEAPDDKTA